MFYIAWGEFRRPSQIMEQTTIEDILTTLKRKMWKWEEHILRLQIIDGQLEYHNCIQGMVRKGSSDRELDGEMRQEVSLGWPEIKRQEIEMSGEGWESPFSCSIFKGADDDDGDDDDNLTSVNK